MLRQPIPAPENLETSPRYAGWRVVAASFLVAVFCWGFGLYGHSVYLAELHRLYGWPTSLISGASTIHYLFSAVLVVFVSDAIARFGPRNVALGGLGCLCASTALLAFAAAPWQLYAAYLVMAFGWASMSVAAITNTVGLWFDARRGFAISVALNGASFGGILIAPALVFLIEAVGFRNGMLIATAATLAILLPVILAWIGDPPQRPGAAAGGVDMSLQWTRTRALRSFAFWTVSAPFALILLVQVGVLVHQIAFLEPKIGRAAAGAAVAVTTIMAVLGRLMVGTVVDRRDQRITSAVLFVLQAGSLFAMTRLDGTEALLACCAVFGITVGNAITLPSLIVQREFEREAFGMIIALSTAIGQFAYALGPGLLGLLRDAAGSYAAPLALFAVIELVGAAVVLIRPTGTLSGRS